MSLPRKPTSRTPNLRPKYAHLDASSLLRAHLGASLPSYSTRKDNRLDDINIVTQITQLKIEQVALKAVKELHTLEQHIEEALVVFELNGSLPGKVTENQLRRRLQEVAKEITRWKTFSDYSSLSHDLKLLHDMRESRKGNLVDSTEIDLVVANVLKDPKLFTDIEYLANGSFGTVYRAKYCGESQVVVKVLNSGIIKSVDAELHFFLNEVKNMMSIQGHDRILPMLGALPYNDNFPPEWKVDQNGIPCKPHAIVMPFMSNGTLEDLLEKNSEVGRKINLQRKYEIALEVCEGMAWIAFRELIHGDLKPENVFFDKYWASKVGDVGLATLLALPENTEDSNFVNHQTTWWTAPELLEMEQDKSKKVEFSCKSDVYSFAIFLWQLFTDVPTSLLVHEIFPPDIILNFEKAVIFGIRPPLTPDNNSTTTEKPTTNSTTSGESLKFTEKILPINKYPHLQCYNLKNILRASWHKDPEARPHFTELLQMIKTSMVNTFLPLSLCENASSFWRSHFDNQTKIPFESFCTNLSVFCEDELSAVVLEVLRDFLLMNQQEEMVSISEFSIFLNWFGPMKQSEKTLLHAIEELVVEPWFFGNISDSVAHSHLQVAPEGTCMVRFHPCPTMEFPFIVTRRLPNSVLDIPVKREKGTLAMSLQMEENLITVQSSSPHLQELVKLIPIPVLKQDNPYKKLVQSS